VADCENDNMELKIEVSEEKFRRIKEVEISLERETCQRKTTEATLGLLKNSFIAFWNS